MVEERKKADRLGWIRLPIYTCEGTGQAGSLKEEGQPGDVDESGTDVDRLYLALLQSQRDKGPRLPDDQFFLSDGGSNTLDFVIHMFHPLIREGGAPKDVISWKIPLFACISWLQHVWLFPGLLSRSSFCENIQEKDQAGGINWLRQPNCLSLVQAKLGRRDPKIQPRMISNQEGEPRNVP